MTEQLKAYNNLYDVNERKQLIAQSLKTLRNKEKYTKQQVADWIGVKLSTYSTYESGRNEPPTEILVRLSFLYNVPIDIIVQKDNFSKDKLVQQNTVEAYGQNIQQLKKQLEKEDPQTQKALSSLLDGIEKMNDKIAEIINAGNTDGN